LIYVAVLALAISNLLDLHAMSAAASAGFLVIVALVNTANARLAQQTASKGLDFGGGRLPSGTGYDDRANIARARTLYRDLFLRCAMPFAVCFSDHPQGAEAVNCVLPRDRCYPDDGGSPMHTILFYELVDDYLERRAQFRQQHLGLAQQAQQRGELVLAGALADPPDGAVLVFQGDCTDVAKAFAKLDPYVTNGLVKAWRVRKWTTVIGGD
jgi:uncharacterized protein YciI